jgi:hypothetical protein
MMGSRVQHDNAALERHFVVDGEGRGLRATWRPDRGFINLSIWRDQRCVETFHLTPADAGQLIGFMAGALTAAVPIPQQRRLRLARDGESVAPGANGQTARLRRIVAGRLERTADRLRGLPS